MSRKSGLELRMTSPLALRRSQLALRELAQEQQRRGLQGAEPEPEPEIGENVKIIKPTVVRCGGPGGTTADGNFDYSKCTDRAFASCHAEACEGHRGGKHRRAQAQGTCDATTLPSRTDAITTTCCDEPSEDCSTGYPQMCNAGCAHGKARLPAKSRFLAWQGSPASFRRCT